MKKVYFLLLFTGCIARTHTGFGQTSGTVTGQIQDGSGAGVSFATVSVVQASDTAVVTGTVSEADGKFSLKVPGGNTYSLRLTAVGYAPYKTPAFTVTNESFTKDFGKITLKTDAKQLKEVNVQALRSTIRQEADRMVVGVEGTALAAGTTAFSVLAKVPGVFVDQEGTIQLNGRTGVTVMINGKLTYLSARDLRTMLEGMSAENIKNIEIITNPSAKYDAEGASGILNINLKKNQQQGMNGSLYSGYTYNGKQHGYTAGGTINYRSRQWNSFLTLDMAQRVGGREATFTRVFYATKQTTYFDQVATGNYIVQGPPAVRIGTDYSLNDRHSLGVMANYTTNNLRSDFLTSTYIGNAPNTPNLFIDADNYGRNRFRNFTSNLHYLGKLDTSGTTLSADADFVQIRNQGESNFYNYFTDLTGTQPNTQDFLYTDTPNGYDIYSAKVDFTHPFARGRKLELGAKASRVVSDNDSRFYFANDEVPILDPQRTNHFIYQETISAAYVNWSGKINNRYTVQAGLRAEQTRSTGESLTTGQVTNRNYLNWFPSLFVQQKVNDSYDITYNYSRRIQRPYYGNLNPFISYRDPYTLTQGNPYLRPQYAHAFSVNQTFRKSYSLLLSYQLTHDVISELPMLDVEKATTIYYTGNVNDAYNISLTGIVPVKLRKNWDSQSTLVVAYSKFSTVVDKEPLVNDQLFYMLQSNHTVQLPLDLRLKLNLGYRGPAASGLYRIDSQWWVHTGLKKSLMQKKLDVSLSANDLFKGQRLKFTTDIGGNINDFDQYFRNRTISVTVRYHFSRGEKFDMRRRTNSLDELNRTGN